METLAQHGTQKALTGQVIYVYRYTVVKLIDGILYDCTYERHILGTLESNYLIDIKRAE